MQSSQLEKGLIIIIIIIIEQIPFICLYCSTCDFFFLRKKTRNQLVSVLPLLFSPVSTVDHPAVVQHWDLPLTSCSCHTQLAKMKGNVVGEIRWKGEVKTTIAVPISQIAQVCVTLHCGRENAVIRVFKRGKMPKSN
jgi:hypothetical protein